MRAISSALQPGAHRALVLGIGFLGIALVGAYELSGMVLANDVISRFMA